MIQNVLSCFRHRHRHEEGEVCPDEDEAGNVFYTVFNFFVYWTPSYDGGTVIAVFIYLFGGAMYTGVGIIMARGREDRNA